MIWPFRQVVRTAPISSMWESADHRPSRLWMHNLYKEPQCPRYARGQRNGPT
jgi:hypothetical protein